MNFHFIKLLDCKHLAIKLAFVYLLLTTLQSDGQRPDTYTAHFQSIYNTCLGSAQSHAADYQPCHKFIELVDGEYKASQAPGISSKSIDKFFVNFWVSQFDKHARIVEANEFSDKAAENSIEISDLGIKLRSFHKKLLVAYVMNENSTIHAGDEILLINGNRFDHLESSEAQLKLKKIRSPYQILVGRKNTTLWLTENNTSTKKIENVEAYISTNKNLAVGYITIRSFEKFRTCEYVADAIKKLNGKNVNSIVLNLENNPGGLVSEAACVGGLFTGAGNLFASLKPTVNKNIENVPASPSSKYANKKEASIFTSSNKISEASLLVKINQNTASAAEMLAAFLQDNKRAAVVGARSFGKGSLQSAFNPWNDGDLILFKTTHLIERPSGKLIQYAGVQPDIVTQRAEGPNFPREFELTQ